MSPFLTPTSASVSVSTHTRPISSPQELVSLHDASQIKHSLWELLAQAFYIMARGAVSSSSLESLAQLFLRLGPMLCRLRSFHPLPDSRHCRLMAPEVAIAPRLTHRIVAMVRLPIAPPQRSLELIRCLAIAFVKAFAAIDKDDVRLIGTVKEA